jgi:hypothetical protein
MMASNIVLHAVGVYMPISSMVVLEASTKKYINDLNNSNPVKLDVLRGSLFYLCFFSKSPFISDAPEKSRCKVYSGTLIVFPVSSRDIPQPRSKYIA